MVGVLPATPAHADPTAADVKKQIDAAWQKLEPVIEQYNRVRSELEANQKRYAELSRKIGPLGTTVEQTKARVQGIAVTRYMGGRVSALNALLTNGSPTALVDQLAM